MPTFRPGPYEIQVVRHESVGAPAELVTVYRRKAFVEMVIVPVEVVPIAGSRALELGAVVREARRVVHGEIGADRGSELSRCRR